MARFFALLGKLWALIFTRAEQAVEAVTPPDVALRHAEHEIVCLLAKERQIRREHTIAVGLRGSWREMAKRAVYLGQADHARAAAARVVAAERLAQHYAVELQKVERAIFELRCGLGPLQRAVLDDQIARAREAVGFGKRVARAAEHRNDMSEARRDFEADAMGEDALRWEERATAIDDVLADVTKELPCRALPAARVS